jgi:hypothetical protein
MISKYQVIKVDWVSPTMKSMKRMLRLEAHNSPHGGTPETSIKLRLGGGPPIERLRTSGRIGPIEVAAADEIELAVYSITNGLNMKGISLERIDRGQDSWEPAAVVDAQNNYNRWAKHWTLRLVGGDQTLWIVRAAIIELKSFHAIDGSIGMREGTAAKAVIWGLRDYCVRSGWLTNGKLASDWSNQAAVGWKNRSIKDTI